jgi:uncharacterized protein YjbJ (UPF0337 family)
MKSICEAEDETRPEARWTNCAAGIREAGGAISGSDRGRMKGRARQDKGTARKKRGHLRDLFRKVRKASQFPDPNPG